MKEIIGTRLLANPRTRPRLVLAWLFVLLPVVAGSAWAAHQSLAAPPNSPASDGSHLPFVLVSRPQKRAAGGCTCEEMEKLGIFASYNWSPNGGNCPDGRARYPMLKVPGADDVQTAIRLAEETGVLLYLNEPDQERISLSQALDVFRGLDGMKAKKVVSTGSQLQLNLTWIREFHRAYQQKYDAEPAIDALATHCYYRNVESMLSCQRHVQRVIDQAVEWDIPEVWVTEFACVPGDLYSIRQCKEVSEVFMNWLEEQLLVRHYFLFACRVDPQKPWHGGSMFNSLFWWNEPHDLTTWGEWYKSQP